MNRKLFFAITAIFGIITSFIFIENPIETVIKGYERYLKELPQEKVYLHLDRPYYSAGDTIRYKAYLTAGALHESSPFSKTLYVELIGKDNNIHHSHKLYVEEGRVSGYLYIPDTIKSGNYMLRAYTAWMRNFPKDYFFYKELKIWNPQTQDTLVSQELSNDAIDIHFFPEGGNMVHGLPGKVAFKAVNAEGKGCEVSGVILDESGREVVEFQSNSLGFGLLFLLPEAGKSYHAVLKTNGKKYDLPEPKSSGISLNLSNNPAADDLILRIVSSPNSRFTKLYIVSHVRGVLNYTAQVDMSSNIALAKIPRASFLPGVAQVTILDEQGFPLAERLVFAREPAKGNVMLETDKKQYKPREKVKLDVHLQDTAGMPVFSDVSLCVVDAYQAIWEVDREDILSYLWLKSELKGRIEDPGYYFNPDREDRWQALDMLLMTQGWRRFSIQEAMQKKWDKPAFGIEQGLILAGKIKDKYNGNPIDGAKVTYMNFSPFPENLEAKTNQQGQFLFTNLVYFDSARAVLQAETRKGKKFVALEIEDYEDKPQADIKLPDLKTSLQQYERDFITRSQQRKQIDRAYDFEGKTIILEGLEIKGEKVNPREEIFKLYGGGSLEVKVDGDPFVENLFHPLQILQGRVAGVQITGSGDTWQVTIRGISSINGPTEPLFLIDDLPVPIEALSSLSVRDIDTYIVWKGPDAAVFGARGANGAIGFYTKRGATVLEEADGVFPLLRKGYQMDREFYAPKYDTKLPEHVKPDYRVTLHWEPFLQTDSTGRASVEFYNHDLEAKVLGIVEGITPEGLPIVGAFEYEIKK